MEQMRGSNPTLNEGVFRRMAVVGHSPDQVFTVNGAVGKTGVLLGIVVAAAAVMWNVVQSNPGGAGAAMGLALILCLVGLGLAVLLAFVPSLAMFLSPVYAVCQGVVLGTISSALELQPKYQGLTFLAVALTLGVFAAMLLAYRARLIQATQKFRAVVVGATLGICVTYLLSLGLSFFGMRVPFIHESGLLGIGFSLFVIVIAALNLILDFEFIERASETPTDKRMEWYAAFGLLVTLVWLYIEILRLLAKLRR